MLSEMWGVRNANRSKVTTLWLYLARHTSKSPSNYCKNSTLLSVFADYSRLPQADTDMSFCVNTRRYRIYRDRLHNWYGTCWLLTYLLTYLFTPLSGVLLEKPTGSQLVKKFPAFYGTRRFITSMIYWSIRSAQHVSGNILPIIRSVRLRYLQHMVSCRCGG